MFKLGNKSNSKLGTISEKKKFVDTGHQIRS